MKDIFLILKEIFVLVDFFLLLFYKYFNKRDVSETTYKFWDDIATKNWETGIWNKGYVEKQDLKFIIHRFKEVDPRFNPRGHWSHNVVSLK